MPSEFTTCMASKFMKGHWCMMQLLKWLTAKCSILGQGIKVVFKCSGTMIIVSSVIKGKLIIINISTSS